MESLGAETAASGWGWVGGGAKTDSSKDSRTFDKNLGEALLFPDHALVRRVIRQVALVDGERPLVAHALKHVPGWGGG